jgi:hypothetical protein
VDAFDALEFPEFRHHIVWKNFPDNFSAIDWSYVRHTWKECVREVDRATDQKNVSGRNDTSDGEGEEVQKKFSYVEYWSCFAENNPGIFKSMNCPMPDGAYSQSSTPTSSSSTQSSSSVVKKRKTSYVYDNFYPPEPRDQVQNMHFQEKILDLDQHERTLSMQTDTKETRQKRTAIAERRTMVAEKQLMALESHLRAERIRTLKSDVENFRKENNWSTIARLTPKRTNDTTSPDAKVTRREMHIVVTTLIAIRMRVPIRRLRC